MPLANKLKSGVVSPSEHWVIVSDGSNWHLLRPFFAVFFSIAEKNAVSGLVDQVNDGLGIQTVLIL